MAKKAKATNSEEPRRFEFIEGSSAKFWEIKLDGTTHTVTYGRIGTAGTDKTKEFADVDAARKSYDKLIAAKTKKGYAEVQQAEKPSDADVAAAKAYAKNIKPFIQTILEDPDDIGGYSVLGDWLTEQGDPRGEFFQLQIALEDESLTTAQRKKLAKQEKALLKKHERTWLGELAIPLEEKEEWSSSPLHQYKFARGVLDTIKMGHFSLELGHALKKSHQCSTLRSLIVESSYYVEEPVTVAGKTYEEETGLDTLIGAKFDNLRVFQLGEEEENNCHTDGEQATDVIKKMPRIEELRIFAHNVDTAKLFKFKMPHLRTLTAYHLHEYPVELLARNKSLTNLETLQFQPHAIEFDEQEGYLRLEHIKAIGKSKNLVALRHLQFRLSDMGDPGIEAMIKTGLLGRLKTLDLQYGCVTDAGVDMLVASDQLSNLEMLNLDGNAITSVGIAALKKSKVKHTAKEQHDADTIEGDYLEYLGYGDIE